MPNPWLSLPLADYEGHMSAPEVQQLEPLAELFAETLALCHPASLAVIGIAGGNGLDRIDRNVTKRVVGLDMNPLYLDAVRQRHSGLSGLELHCIDLAEERVDMEPVQLVYAALVFEHAGVGRCLENALSMVASGGALSIVLQLPSEIEHAVGASRFPAMQSLKSHFSLIDPAWFRETLEARNFRFAQQARRSLPAGKAFWMGVFNRG
jgi:hypothetical protein